MPQRPRETDESVEHKAERRQPIIIGLAGGIGSGKSTVARALADLGALVLDSDHTARAALARPEVLAQLREWWGDDCIAEDGSPDRRAIARIIFADGAQRSRLESLIHPLVTRLHDQQIAETDGQQTPMIVIDSPLLFEAGLDDRCDALIFVDAPRPDRLARVRQTRGWDEAELIRREKSQLPLENKRRRVHYTIVNDADPAGLVVKVRELFETIMSTEGRGPK